MCGSAGGLCPANLAEARLPPHTHLTVTVVTVVTVVIVATVVTVARLPPHTHLKMGTGIIVAELSEHGNPVFNEFLTPYLPPFPSQIF